MYQIVKRSKIIFFVSLILVIAGIVMLVKFGLKLGLDFTGGTLQTVTVEKQATSPDVTKALEEIDIKGAKVQIANGNKISLRMSEISQEQRTKILNTLKEKYGNANEESFETIGPTIGKELRQKTLYAVIGVVGAILLYIAFAFRKVTMPPSWVYGFAAVVALMHDLIITIGVFVLLGKFANVEVDTLFVTALLTTLGYSVNDTIVVFDRIRENVLKNKQDAFEQIVNQSINEVMVRSLNTSLTTILALLALLFFGGESIHYFVIALLVGITAGTYSSIFVASPVLVFWQNFRQRRKLKKAA